MASTSEKPTTGGSIPGPGDGLPHHHHQDHPHPNPPNTAPSHARTSTGLRIRDWVRSPTSGSTRHQHHHDHHGHDHRDQRHDTAPGPDSDPAPERHRAPRHDPWWKIHLFRGMVNDVRKRAPYYASDWTDAWNYRVVPATVYMFFAKSVLFSFFALLFFSLGFGCSCLMCLLLLLLLP